MITGGSSGIGLALAEQFAAQGASLSLLARDIVKLSEARQYLLRRFGEHLPVSIHAVDVSDRNRFEATIREIGETWGIVALINNAGLQDAQPFERQSVEAMQFVMDANYWGAVYATKAALPYLKREVGGHVGFVGSVASYTGVFGYTAYSGSKFAMNGLAECLRIELKPMGIGVTILFPPDTDTPLLAREQKKAPPETVAMTKGASLMSAEAVAKRFMKGILNNRLEVLCNAESWGIRLLKTVAPGLYFRIIDGMIAKVKKARPNQAETSLPQY